MPRHSDYVHAIQVTIIKINRLAYRLSELAFMTGTSENRPIEIAASFSAEDKQNQA
jgi:hypothetical protein